VVEPGTDGSREGKLVGILTNRDVRFATNPKQPVAELMTKSDLITVRENVGMEEAKRLLHQHRIEKLLVVDEDYRCIGLITVKDIEKARAHPHACKDEQGRLRVAAATSVGDSGFARAEHLIDAGADLIVVDTAHGHSALVLDQVRRIKRQSNAVQVVAGNVATADGTKALIDAGADAIKVGIGPGSICTTRVIAGVGVPQFTALLESAEVAKKSDIPVISPRRSPPAPTARCSGLCLPAPTRVRAKCFSIRAGPTRLIAAWARSAPWRGGRPTATSSKRSGTR
jgi:IMP dehydrogenase